jgi:hypothetical protein
MSRRFRVAFELAGSPDPDAAASALGRAGSSPFAEGRVPVRPQPVAVPSGEVELTYRVVTEEEGDESALERIAESRLEGPGLAEAWLWSVVDLAEAAELAADDLSVSVVGRAVPAARLRLVVDASLPRSARGI